MQKYIPVLQKTQIFAGVSAEEISGMLGCLQAKLRRYAKGEYVFRQGETVRHVCVLGEGALHIRRDDYWGNRSIVSSIVPGEMFGEAYAAPGGSEIMHDVVAVEESAVLFFDVARLLTVCSTACPFHAAVVRNLFFAVAERNRKLVQKLGHMSRRTTREKLLSYLSDEAQKSGGAAFTIPFDRQALADFLSVDRSAMSTELGKLRDEGLVEYRKNRFRLVGK